MTIVSMTEAAAAAIAALSISCGGSGSGGAAAATPSQPPRCPGRYSFSNYFACPLDVRTFSSG